MLFLMATWSTAVIVELQIDNLKIYDYTAEFTRFSGDS